MLINGKIVFDNLPYSLNNATTQRWNVRNIANGTALYDDLAFELYTPHPLSPVPEDGAIIPGGNVALSWTNLPANTGSDVWVDVWFGTAANNLTKVLDGGLTTTTTNVTVPSSGTYYWRVDSYLDGDPDGTPFQTPVISFIVQDTDGDSLLDGTELTAMPLGKADDFEFIISFARVISNKSRPTAYRLPHLARGGSFTPWGRGLPDD